MSFVLGKQLIEPAGGCAKVANNCSVGAAALQELRALLRPKDTGVDDQESPPLRTISSGDPPTESVVERKTDEHRESGACEVNLAARDGR